MEPVCPPRAGSICCTPIAATTVRVPFPPVSDAQPPLHPLTRRPTLPAIDRPLASVFALCVLRHLHATLIQGHFKTRRPSPPSCSRPDFHHSQLGCFLLFNTFITTSFCFAWPFLLWFNLDPFSFYIQILQLSSFALSVAVVDVESFISIPDLSVNTFVATVAPSAPFFQLRPQHCPQYNDG